MMIMKIKIEEIKQLCIDVLVKKGFKCEDASTVVEEYLYGELTGKKSHGFASFLKFAVQKVNSRKGDWKIVRKEPNYALIDGNGNPGQLLGKFAMSMAIEKARKNGMSLVGMNNMESYLMPGYYARMASADNMIGIVIDNSKSRVAPFGGTEPRLGANPIGLAIPTKDTPFVLDMATSSRAMGEVRLAEKMGELLPEGMALDGEGKPTRDPKNVNALTAFGGYKGYGLCLAIEILAGSFVRAKMGSRIKSGLDRGYLFMVINPEIFVDVKTFKEEISELMKEVKSFKGSHEILIPGERAERTMTKNMKNGFLDIDENILEEIRKA